MSDMRDKLLPIFILEAEENLGLIEASITGLEQKRRNAEELTAGFRAAHTIKGTAGLMKLATTSAVAKQLEDTLEQFAEQSAPPAAELIAAARLAFTQLKGLVTLVAGGVDEPAGVLNKVTEAFMAAENGVFPQAVQKEPATVVEIAVLEPPQEVQAPDPAPPVVQEAPVPVEPQPNPATAAPQPLSPAAALAAFAAKPLDANAAEPGSMEQAFLKEMTRLLQGSEDASVARPEIVCCTFKLGDKAYYLPIRNMVEIADIDALTFLPMAPGYVRGLVSLRGDVVPVIDLGHLYDKPSEFDREWHLIVAESRGEHLAFLAEGIPNLATEYQGELLDIDQFIRDYGVKTA